jgi:hypothetical protein
VVTRADLPPGVQACQAVHAAVEFTLAHPSCARASHALALLAARDELALAWMCRDARALGLRIATFHEPDLGNALTAAAFEPAAQALLPSLRRLPTVLSRHSQGGGEKPMTTTDVQLALVEVTAERDALRAQLEGHDLPSATRWLQRKVWRQARALDTLNRKVLTQRFMLRTLASLGRTLSAAEYRQAKAAIGDAQVRQRIYDTADDTADG